MDSKNLIVGIDGDIEKNGLAIYNKKTKELKYSSIDFFDLLKWLIENKSEITQVKIEASWKISKSDFHSSIPKKSLYAYYEVLKYSNISASIGKKVGANHEIGRKIEQFCIRESIPYKLSMPLTKRWKGKGGKITHEEIVKLLQPLGIEMGKRGSQDSRDAILICLY